MQVGTKTQQALNVGKRLQKENAVHPGENTAERWNEPSLLHELNQTIRLNGPTSADGKWATERASCCVVDVKKFRPDSMIDEFPAGREPLVVSSHSHSKFKPTVDGIWNELGISTKFLFPDDVFLTFLFL